MSTSFAELETTKEQLENTQSLLKEMRQRLNIAEETLKLTFEQSSRMFFEYEPKAGRVVLSEALEGGGKPPKVMYSVKIAIFQKKIVHRDSQESFMAAFESLLSGKVDVVSCDVKLFGDGNRYYWYRISMSKVKDSLGELIKIIGIVGDIEKEKAAEFAYLKEEKYKTAMLADAVAYYDINLTTDRIEEYRGMAQPFFKDANQCGFNRMVTRVRDLLVHPEDRARYEKTFSLRALTEANEKGISDVKLEHRRLNEKNEMRWMVMRAHLITDVSTGELKCLAYIKDVHEEKARNIALKYSSQRDSLTELYNKGVTKRKIEDLLGEAFASENHTFLIFDVDRFKVFNDTYGHLFGDKLLSAVAKTLARVFMCKDIVGRTGGDEFIVFMKDTNDIGLIRNSATQICKEVNEIYEIDPLISCSIGVGRFPMDGLTFEELYRAADIALYETKKRGGNGWTIYDSSMKPAEGLAYEGAEEDYSFAEMRAANTDTDWDTEENPRRPEVLSITDRSKLLDEIADTIYVADPENYELLFMNKKLRNHLNLDREQDYIGKKCYEILDSSCVPCEDCTNHMLNFDEYYAWEFESTHTGKYYMVKDKLVYFNGKPAKIQLAMDITEKQTTNQSLSRQLEIESRLMQCVRVFMTCDDRVDAAEGILETVKEYYGAAGAYIDKFDGDKGDDGDGCGMRIKKNQQFAEVMRSVREAMAGLWSAGDRDNKPTMINQIKRLEARYPEGIGILQGNNISEAYEMPVIMNGRLAGYIGVINPLKHRGEVVFLEALVYLLTNEVDRRKAAKNIEYMSYHDVLTGLVNVNRYLEYEQLLKEKELSSLGIVVCDINGLKVLNGKYGHEYGDEIVKGIAKILKEKFCAHQVFRMSGDEFTVVCEDISKEEFENKIAGVKRAVWVADGDRLAMGSTWENFDMDLAILTARADAMLQLEKQKYYEREQNDGSRGNLGILRKILEDLKNGKYKVFLQPKVNAKTESICGAEALVRFMPREGTLVLPGSFIPTLERDNMIRYMDLFVFEEVCKILRDWRGRGYEPIPISFNFSRITFMDYSVLPTVVSIIEQYEVPQGLLEVEVTESLGEMEMAEATRIVGEFKKAGMRVVLDDFGAKYTSLWILSKMDIDIIKLDRSLISNIADSSKGRTVVRHAIDMCGELGISVVAEGIEDEAQFKILKEYGCGELQGYLFGRPMAIDQFEMLCHKKQDTISEAGSNAG